MPRHLLQLKLLDRSGFAPRLNKLPFSFGSLIHPLSPMQITLFMTTYQTHSGWEQQERVLCSKQVNIGFKSGSSVPQSLQFTISDEKLSQWRQYFLLSTWNLPISICHYCFLFSPCTAQLCSAFTVASLQVRRQLCVGEGNTSVLIPDK